MRAKQRLKMFFALYTLEIKIKIPNSFVKQNTEMEADTAKYFMLKYNNKPNN